MERVGAYLSGLACRVRGTDVRLAVALPPGGRHLPLLLASAAVLDDVLTRAFDIEHAIEGRVLIVSPDLDVRSRYCDLYVQTASLDDAYPGGRVLPNGDVVPLRAVDRLQGDKGVCFFLPGLELPKRINFGPALIILDLRYAKWPNRAANLAAWSASLNNKCGVLALYSVGDLDTANALERAKFTDLPFDQAAIATCGDQSAGTRVDMRGLTVDWSLAKAPDYLRRKHEVKEVPGGDTVSTLISKIGGLLDEHERAESPDLNRARWLLAMLSQVPVPLVWYEQAAHAFGRSTIRRMISYLGSRSRHLVGLGAVMQTLRMSFDELYRLLESLNPRAEALKLMLPDIVRSLPNDGNLLLLVRDRTVARALQTWLEVDAFPDIKWLTRVEVKACAEYARMHAGHYSASVINGAFPRRYRWLAGAALGTQVTFLCYPHEVEVIQSQLEWLYGERAVMARARKRAEAISQLIPGTPNNDGGAKDAAKQLPALQLKKPHREGARRAAPQPHASGTGLSQLMEVLATARRTAEEASEEELGGKSLSWKEDAGEEEAPVEGLEQLDVEPHEDDVLCLSVRVNSQAYGAGMLWLPSDEMVECVRPDKPDDLSRLSTRELKPGDVLLRTDGEGRVTLFDRIVELAEDQPHLSYLAAFRQRWRNALQKLAAKFGDGWRTDYQTMLRELRRYGAPIQSEQAIRAWVNDYVIGPDDIRSVMAVGRVTGLEALERNANDFDAAFRSIRGIRQGLGRRLNGAIRRSFKHFAAGTSAPQGDQLDDRLGVPMDELLATIDLSEVVAVGDEEQAVPVHLVGRFRPVG